MTRTIQYQLFIKWDAAGSYVDESANLIAASGQHRLHNPEDSITAGRGIVDQCTLLMRNPNMRYSPLNDAGPLYTYIQDGGAYHAPMYLNVSIDGVPTHVRAFTGVIKIPRETGQTSRDIPIVEIDCRSRDETILNSRLSTTLADFLGYNTNGYTEGELIRDWLLDAGLTAPDMGIAAGLYPIPWAWLDDESPLEEIWQLAAACGGRFFVDADGLFTYQNATTWLTAARSISSQETITKAGFVLLQPLYNDRELYKEITVEVARRDILDSSTIWESEEVVVVPTNSNKTVVARLRQPAYAVSTVNYTAITSGGVDVTSDVSIVMTKYAQRVSLAITNANTSHAANLVELSLTGQAIDGRPGAEETRTSTNAFWSTRTARVRSLRGNAYVQSGAQAAAVAEFLKDRYEVPRLYFRLSGTLGNPSRKLGDRITITDNNVISLGGSNSREVLIVGIDWRLDSTGFVQDLTCLDAVSLYPYQDTTPAYFVIGTNKLGAADAARGRVFY